VAAALASSTEQLARPAPTRRAAQAMRLLPRYTTSRLILALTVIVGVVSGVSAYVTARIQEQALLDEMVTGADQLSHSITAATWQAMRANRRDDAYAIMASIGREQGIESIRIFNNEGLLAFSTDPKAAARVEKSDEICYLCHAREAPLVRVDVPSRARVFHGPDGRRKLAIVTPLYNEAACAGAACHAHPETRHVLGVLYVAMDVEPVDRQVAASRRNALLWAVAETLLIGVLIVVFTRRVLSRPIRELIRGTQSVAAMDLDRRIEIDTADEFGELARAFDLMRQRLKDALAKINEFTHALEDKVAERTRQLGFAQRKLIQSDRMASLGQLAASVAHEINNPIAGVLNFNMLMERILTPDGIPAGRVEDFRHYTSASVAELERVGRIVSDLLAFSRQSSPVRTDADLSGIVNQTVALLAHKFDLAGVRLDLRLAQDLPPLRCDASQIQQVVVNLLMNAVEASRSGGVVEVSTESVPAESAVELVVSDSGIGIPEDNLVRVYEPFFSTKGEGKGVGLGLAVVYGIVRAHGATIDVSSTPDEGTTFRVRFPLTASAPAAEAAAAGDTPAGTGARR
jgi:two-component system NtrC family sensor kinase